MKTVRITLGLLALTVGGRFQSAHAQQVITPVIPDPSNHTIVDVNGLVPTDPDALIFRAGTDPLVPVTHPDGHQVTLAEWTTDVTGQFTITAKPGGGSDIMADVQGLFPGGLYSFWAGYWEDPGFPFGPRIAFGAMTRAGDGSDNFMTADENGTVSILVGQLEGPMTIHGSAPAFVLDPIAFNSDGDPVVHTGYKIGIAYHFNNPPSPPFLNPGPPETWALQGFGEPVPEPSSAVLLLMGGACYGIFRRRRR